MCHSVGMSADHVLSTRLAEQQEERLFETFFVVIVMPLR